MKSIRTFLTISIISIIILANFLAALHGYQKSMQEAEILFDHKLEDYSEILALSASAQTDQNIATQPANEKEIKLDVSIASQSDVIFQVRDDNHKIIIQSDIFNIEQSNSSYKFRPIVGKNYVNFANFRWRSLTRYFSHKHRWVLVMEKQDVRYKLAESVILESVYPIIIAVPTVALIIFFIVRWGLKPVAWLASSVDKKQADNLSPIQIENVPDELISLTKRINDLLFRLERTLSREKRFASDAAHELRTPIAALNIQMKNLLDEGQNKQDSVAELSVGVKRMSHLVEQILVLNRASPEFFAEQFKSIDLSRLLKDMVAEVYPLIDEKNHEIELIEVATDEKGFFVSGEEFSLNALFKNLMTNAIKYTPDRGHIQIKLERSEQFVMVAIMDSGPGIAHADRERIFERFYRLDGDRNQSKVIGCGLGLAIVKQIADLHHATIKLSTSQFEIENEQTISSGLCVTTIFQKTSQSG